jgi:hypothetical protein
MRARCLDERGVAVVQGTSLELLDARFRGNPQPDGASLYNSMIRLPGDRPCEVGVRLELRAPEKVTETFFCWQRPGAAPPTPGRCTQFSATPSVGLVTAEPTKIDLRDGSVSLALPSDDGRPRARIGMRLTLGSALDNPIETNVYVQCHGKEGDKTVSWQGQGRFTRIDGWYEPGDVLQRAAEVSLLGPEKVRAETCFVSLESAIAERDKRIGRDDWGSSGRRCFGRQKPPPSPATPPTDGKARSRDLQTLDVPMMSVLVSQQPLVKDGIGCS